MENNNILQSEPKKTAVVDTAFDLRLNDIIQRAFENRKSAIDVSGCQSTGAAALLLSNDYYNTINNLTHLVVVSNLDQAEQIKKQLTFFRPDLDIFFLPSFDVQPYSGLYPSPNISWQRTQFLYWAAQPLGVQPQPQIFIATVAGLLQKTAPFFNFHRRGRRLQIGDELPEKLAVYLNALGYQPAPLVEDRGQYSIRGGIVDVFSTAEKYPVRIELFGDQIESLRVFSNTSQLSLNKLTHFHLAPVYEFELSDENLEHTIARFRDHLKDRKVDHAERDEAFRALSQRHYFPGLEYILPFSYEKLQSPLEHFSNGLNIIMIDPVEVSRMADEFFQTQVNDGKSTGAHLFHPEPHLMFESFESVAWPLDSNFIRLSNLDYLANEKMGEERIEYPTSSLVEFSNLAQHLQPGSGEWLTAAAPKFQAWKKDQVQIVVSVKGQTQLDRVKNILTSLELDHETMSADDYDWPRRLQSRNKRFTVLLVQREFRETILLSLEKLIFLRDDDFLGRRQRARAESTYEEFADQAKRLSFGELKLNDLVVHVKHGVGVYEGLKIMNIGGVESEYIQVGYKDKDKLYLPVYRVGQLQKYSGSSTSTILDKLGGTSWEKTKIKVKNHLRDIAAELLQLYAKRSEVTRDPLMLDPYMYGQFERAFPYEETRDQMRAIQEIQKDFASSKPMDRLVCGDVGFGKTEVAMRAAFEAVTNKKQVAVLAPTTVLTFQHLETFKKRFAEFPYQIRSLNRFVSAADAKKTLSELKLGKVDILIGTHRIFSKDVQFQNLGLLIIDEEQKFGVTHKEKIKKLKLNVDTLTLSATPIPRTLNMSFTGLRDLSIINTAPVDRLPTRTFVTKFDPEQIRKAVQAEIARGGQVYFIHNRVQPIYALAEELRKIMPDARVKVAHGQMEEDELESAMLAFFNHEIDVLICTAIVESGMDVPRANTMFIDQAHMFGLSQLYQLRGRVGRSKTRAYCYLLMPKDRKLEKEALERLKIIQDNSALGSGIKIAQYDLELRGAGNILGDDQSGHVNTVGYEMYMDLLNEALAEAKGEMTEYELDPEINLRIPALIPDAYISDIRIRLSYYKALSEIKAQEDLDRIEAELQDQFGPLPEQVVNLMGLMLIRRQCKNLGVRDISAGLKNISLIFTEHTKLKPEKAIELTLRANKKYSLLPDQRLNIRLNTITWSAVYEELNYLLSLI